MGLCPDDFDQMTVAQFIYAWFGWADAEQTKERAKWERARWAAYMNMVVQLDPKDRRPMIQMLPLPWDDPHEQSTTTPSPLTIEERRRRALELTQRQ